MAETEEPGLPREPIHRLVGPLERFLHVEAASGVVLLLCAITALVLANSPLSEQFLGLWNTELGFSIGMPARARWAEYCTAPARSFTARVGSRAVIA